MSNHCGKFLYFVVAALGSFPDAKALACWTQLQQWIDISAHALIPFSGSQQDTPQNSSFNYFSQLRIYIEQAFGQYSVMWRIIRKSLKNLTGNIKSDPDYMCKTS
jgi:hypothetical protein